MLREAEGDRRWIPEGGVIESGLEGSQVERKGIHFQEQHWWRWQGEPIVLSNPRIMLQCQE